MEQAGIFADIAHIARTHDPDRFLCALFAPAAKRDALFTLIAFNHELAHAREAVTNPVAALIRLQFWRETVEEARQGGTPRRHAVAAPLHAAIASGLLEPADLLAMIEGREAEAEAPLPTDTAFRSYLRATAGALAVASGRLLGAEGPDFAVLQSLGALYGLAGVLRSVGTHAAQGRCLLPADRLAETGLTVEAAIREPEAPAMHDLVARLAREGLAAPVPHRGRISPFAIAAALPAVLARRDLRRLARGRAVELPRGLGARLAVTFAGLRGRI